MRPSLLLPLLLAVAPGCVTGSFTRDSRFEPVPRGALRPLQPGESDLQDALDALGAPLWVWEVPGDGMAVAYGWEEERAWGLSFSVPLTRQLSANFDYDDIDADLAGVVLFFDAERRLVEKRRGRLRDLALEELRARPSDPEEQ